MGGLLARNILAAAAIVGACLPLAAAEAGPAGDALGQCLVRKATGEDNVAMVRWIITAFLSNPDVADIAHVDPAVREAADRGFAKTVERLMLVDCHDDAVTAMRAEGSQALEGGFNTLGQRAGQQALLYPGGSAVIGKFADYFTDPRWEELRRSTQRKAN